MLKLRYLFDNSDLARMLLENWEYDASALDLLQDFRISANAVYPFRQQGEVRLLRFCPTPEKSQENVMAELEFIGYLRCQGYNALEPVSSKTGEILIQKATPWGDYYASVFKCVPGKQIGEFGFEDDLVFRLGAALGHLHKLSSAYTHPRVKRWTHLDVFAWIENTFETVPVEASAGHELALLRNYFLERPRHPGNYGLVHYDFELDNVFYDPQTKTCSVIDFDDAVYHWYVVDIAQTLDSLQDEGNFATQEFRQKQAAFLAGYQSQFAVSADQLAMLPACRRFANLYSYARLTRAMQEEWENEPEWLVKLRMKLRNALRNKSTLFGTALEI